MRAEPWHRPGYARWSSVTDGGEGCGVFVADDGRVAIARIEREDHAAWRLLTLSTYPRAVEDRDIFEVRAAFFASDALVHITPCKANASVVVLVELSGEAVPT